MNNVCHTWPRHTPGCLPVWTNTRLFSKPFCPPHNTCTRTYTIAYNMEKFGT
ncbi:Alpha-ketoglutarate-dependent dioxygenase FTO [Gossypium arboreum]|uniref:Alpha-ketoglutarate-dependent dioxygenase FTO n=1 Tax=Gossypium arboreum TaxID=29729 RepID=A0A0B0M842_GOSAR|nr:Alpha-ketoglutarate-dependent dioxygenase FTO [Gossypium arboreum]